MKRVTLALLFAVALASPALAQEASAPPATTPEPATTPQALMPPAPPGSDDRARWKRNLRAPTHNALLLYPFAFVDRGFSLAYERAFRADPRFAILGRFAFEAPASADYLSRAVGVGAEGRFYFLGRGPFTRYHGRAPVGPYVGARVSVTTTWLLESKGGSVVGTSERLGMEASFGCRFPIAGIVELTPSIGFLLYTDFVEGIASSVRPTASFGLTVGVLFERRRR